MCQFDHLNHGDEQDGGHGIPPIKDGMGDRKCQSADDEPQKVSLCELFRS
jgi:hypothetical protein